MKKDFMQVNVSPGMELYFGKGFRKRWGLKPYYSKDEPAVFFGIYDIKPLLEHRNYAIIIFGNTRRHMEVIKVLVLEGKFFTKTSALHSTDPLTALGIPHKNFDLAVKDYDNFPINKRGDKIYLYKGIHGNREQEFNWEETYETLKTHFGASSIIYAVKQPVETLIRDYYSEAFVYVKSGRGGMTTMWEMAHMGKPTIASNMEQVSFLYPYTDTKDLPSIIESIRCDEYNPFKLRREAQSRLIDDRWLTLDFWLNSDECNVH